MALGWSNIYGGRGRRMNNGKLFAWPWRCRSVACDDAVNAGNGVRVPCCVKVTLSGMSSGGTFVYDHAIPPVTHTIGVGPGQEEVMDGGYFASTLTVAMGAASKFNGLSFVCGPGVTYFTNEIRMLSGGLVTAVYDADVGGGSTNILIPFTQVIRVTVGGPFRQTRDPVTGKIDPSGPILFSVNVSLSWLMRATSAGEGSSHFDSACSSVSWSTRGSGGVQLFQGTATLSACNALRPGGPDVVVANAAPGSSGTYMGVQAGPNAFGGIATVTPMLCTSADKFGDDGPVNTYYSPGAYQAVAAALTLDDDQHEADFLQVGEMSYWTESQVTKSDVFGAQSIYLRQGPITDGSLGTTGVSAGGSDSGVETFRDGGAYWAMDVPGVRGVVNSDGQPVPYVGMLAERFNPADPRPGQQMDVVFMMFAPTQNNRISGLTVAPGGNSHDGPCVAIDNGSHPIPPPNPWDGLPDPTTPQAASGTHHGYSFSRIGSTIKASALGKCPQQYCVRLIDPLGVEFGVQLKKGYSTWTGANLGYNVTLANLFSAVDKQSRWVLTITKTDGSGGSAVTSTWRFATRVDWAAPLIDACNEFDYGLQGCPPFTLTAAASPWFPLPATTSSGGVPPAMALKLFCPLKLASADASCACTCSGTAGGTQAICYELFTSDSDGQQDTTGSWSAPAGGGILYMANPSLVFGPDGKALILNKWYVLPHPSNPNRCRASYYKQYGLAQLDGTCSQYVSSPPPVVPAGTQCQPKTIRDPDGPPTRFRCVRAWVSYRTLVFSGWRTPIHYGSETFCVDTDDPTILAVWNKWGDVDALACAIFYFQDCGRACTSADLVGEYQCVGADTDTAFVPPMPPIIPGLFCGNTVGDPGSGSGSGSGSGYSGSGGGAGGGLM